MQNLRWNSDFAYGIGLLATDGCLSPDKRHIEFCSKDLEAILNFKKSFELKNRIGKKKRGGIPNTEYYRIQFGDVKLYDYLTSIGLSPRKSLSMGALKIPKKFFADFLRGVIDGDGSIGYFMHPESKEKQFRIRISSGSLSFLKWLRKTIAGLQNIRGTIIKIKDAYELCYYKRASVVLSDYIYYRKNLIYLTRKFKIAQLMKSESGETGTRVRLRTVCLRA